MGAGCSVQDYLELKQVFNAMTIHNTSLIQNLTNEECITAYGVQLTQDRSYVLAITSQTKPSGVGWPSPSVLPVFESFIAPYEGLADNSFMWVCPYGSCDTYALARDSSNWEVYGFRIEYCLSIIQPSRCKLQLSVYMLAVVIVMNSLKLLCMIWTLLRTTEPTLVTLRDAIVSFLDRPDKLTRARCLMGMADVSKGPLRWTEIKQSAPNTRPLPSTVHTLVRRRWFAAASPARWLALGGLTLVTLGVVGGLLGIGIHGINYNTHTRVNVLSLGFGRIDTNAVIGGSVGGLVGAVLLANLPQLICSELLKHLGTYGNH